MFSFALGVFEKFRHHNVADTVLYIRNCQTRAGITTLRPCVRLGDLSPYQEGPPNAYGARISRGDGSVTAGVKKSPTYDPHSEADS